MKSSQTAHILIVLTLFVIFGLTSSGCKGTKTDATATDDSGTNDIAFFERGADSGEPGGWRSISENVIGQIETTYEKYGMKVETMERSETGSMAVRAVLSQRDGLSNEKQLLDGLRMLYETFPGQNDYKVKISSEGDPEAEASLVALTKVVEAGYSLDTPAGETASFWTMLNEPSGDEEEGSGSNAGVSSDTGD